MKNTRTEFNGLEVINPILVTKFGLVFDSYKHGKLNALWEEAEIKVVETMPLFNADDFFFQEEIRDNKIWYSFRYYTPKSNIKNRRN